MLVRAYTYVRTMGPHGLRAVSDNAILNANYIKARLQADYDLPYLGHCMHEVVFSARRQKRHGVAATDIAKRLLDLGFYAPSIYFPLIEEALMIEPIETESKEAIDEFCNAMIQIAREAETARETVLAAPVTTPVRRLDQTLAARQPNLRWTRGRVPSPVGRRPLRALVDRSRPRLPRGVENAGYPAGAACRGYRSTTRAAACCRGAPAHGLERGDRDAGLGLDAVAASA